MKRPLLPVVGPLFLCAQSLSALAIEPTTQPSNGADQKLREQVELKRDQISGAADIAPSKQEGSVNVIGAPIDTQDGPTQPPDQ